MEFEFTGSIYVQEEDIEQICSDIEEGADIRDVIKDYISGLDDTDYYIFDYIKSQFIEEIEKRLNKRN